jgi:small-conductance mechanosensitive channel
MAGIVGVAWITRSLVAADAVGTYIIYTTNISAPLNYSASNAIATSSSSAVMVALNAQALLLKELIQEHQKRAADSTQKNLSEKAKWETELVTELQEKSGRVQKSIEQVSQSASATNDLKAAGDVDEQLVFVSTLEARLEQLHQELAATIEQSRVLSMQIGTNKSPDEIGSASLVLGENQRLVKELQKELLDVELRKLEFRAIYKALQK